MHELNLVPAGIIEEVFKDGKPFIMANPIDGQVFDCVFENPGTTEWLMEQDWIVDYDQYKNVPVVDLEALCKQLEEESKIEGIQIVVNYTYGDEVIVTKTFNSSGVVE